MYGNLGCDDCENLGGLFSSTPATATTAAKPSIVTQATSTIPIVGGIIGGITSLFGGGPRDTTGTQTFINGLLVRAFNGDTKADHQIRCLAGDNRFATEFNSKACGYAHAEDRAVAQAAVEQLDAHVSSAGVQPYPMSGAGGGMGGPIIAGMSLGPLLLAGAAGLAIFTLSRSRRR